MAFDPDLPATGVTKFGDLYAILRANFVGLSAGGVEAWTVIPWAAKWSSTLTDGSTGMSYMKDPFGFVHLMGGAWKIDDTAQTSIPITAALPVGYRPEKRMIFYNGFNSPDLDPGWVYIDDDGEIVVEYYYTGDRFSLDGITFKAVAV